MIDRMKCSISANRRFSALLQLSSDTGQRRISRREWLMIVPHSRLDPADHTPLIATDVVGAPPWIDIGWLA
jgi:hypothetical protein